MPEDIPGPDGPDDLNLPPSFFPYGSEEPEAQEEGVVFVQVQVEGVYQGEVEGDTSYLVSLTDGERSLPISIGPFEANAISMAIGGVVPDRPLTHDLVKTLLERTGADLDKVIIDDIWSTVYYAKLLLRLKDGTEIEIDCRPSDAIAVAVRTGAPVYVNDTVLEQASEEG